MSKSTSLSIGLFLLVYFSGVENRSTKPFTAFYNARKNGKLPLHSYTTATRNRPLCYICAEVIIMCLRCFLASKKSDPNVKVEPPLHLPHAGSAFDRSAPPRSTMDDRSLLALAYSISYSSFGVTNKHGCAHKNSPCSDGRGFVVSIHFCGIQSSLCHLASLRRSPSG